MTGIFSTVLVLSLAGIVVTGLILLIKAVFRNILPVRWHYFIWIILLIRLVVPVSPEAPFSIYNYLPFYQDIFTQDTEEHLTKEFAVFIEEPSAAPSREETPVAETEEPATGTKEKDDTAAASPEEQKGSAASLQDTFSGIGFGEISYIWLAGLLAWLSFIAAVYLRLKWKIKKGEEISDPRLLELVDESRNRLKLKREVKVIRCFFVKTPFVTGIIKPKLVLPHGIQDELTEEEMRHVILHELSHVKQKDLFIIWLTNILQALHWFNPVLWYAFSRMRKDSELACDAYVMLHMNPGERNSYGHTIINVLQGISKHRTIPGTTGISISKSELEKRVKMISKFKKPSIKLTLIAFLMVFIAGCIGLTDPADEPGMTDEVNIPDENLKAEIRDTLLIEPGEEITVEDMHNLEYISVAGEPDDEKVIADLSGLEFAKNLELLSLPQSEINDISPLEDLHNLQEVYLYRVELEDLSPLFDNENLKELRFYDNNLGDDDLEQMAKNLQHLETLTMRNNNISNTAPFRYFDNLETLNLEGNNVEDISNLAELEDLNRLWLSDNRITDVSPIGELDGLEELYIGGNEVNDITPLGNLNKLNILDISANSITDISPLRNLDNLVEVDLTGNVLDQDEKQQENIMHLKVEGVAVEVERKLVPELEKEWVTVGEWSGESDKTTGIFTVKGSEWELQWEAHNKTHGEKPGNFEINVYEPGNPEYVWGLHSTLTTKGEDNRLVRLPPGEYYLKIKPQNLEWEIKVEELRYYN